MAQKKQPVKELRYGRIKAVIWENETSNGNGVLYNTNLVRIYRDPETEEWKETHSLGRDDLLLAGKLLDDVHTWIFRHTQSSAKQQEKSESETATATETF